MTPLWDGFLPAGKQLWLPAEVSPSPQAVTEHLQCSENRGLKFPMRRPLGAPATPSVAAHTAARTLWQVQPCVLPCHMVHPSPLSHVGPSVDICDCRKPQWGPQG